MRYISYALLLLIAGVVYAGLVSYRTSAENDVDRSAVPVRVPESGRRFVEQAEAIRPLHERKRPVKPGDWLDRFPEGGQSFGQFVQLHNDKRLRDQYSVIVFQPLGEFDATQLKIVDRTAEFLGLFFGVEVRLLPARPLDEPPTEARHVYDGNHQVLTKWINQHHLLPERSDDAIAVIGLVTCDLWPGVLNWVFGAASPADRVAVWSLYRNGDPSASSDEYRLCLLRTLKTAVHEAGHALGMPHCSAYECGMNGTRSREENDLRPLEFCPECQAKIWWTCGADPRERCEGLMTFAEREGFVDETNFWRRLSKHLIRSTN